MRLRPLRDCTSRELRPLLEEECALWADELLWDFRDVTSAVARGLDRRALVGRVIHADRHPVAYSYALVDAGRFLLGSLFASRAARGRGLEEELLEALLADAHARPGCARVECQTLFTTAPGVDRRLRGAGFASRHRHYLVRRLADPLPQVVTTFRLRRFRRDEQDLAARIIHSSHAGSVDAVLHLAYATVAQCRGFVETLVERGGCGPFDDDASCVAERADGTPVGLILASRLSRRNGHIGQVSVLPEAQGCGLGTALLVATLSSFARAGLASVSLSVTVENRPAYRMYTALGFSVRKAFGAHAWVRPPARLMLPA